MASLPRCSLALAASAAAPKSRSRLQRTWCRGLVSKGTPCLPVLDFLLPPSIVHPISRSANVTWRDVAPKPVPPPARESRRVSYSHGCQSARQYKPSANAWCSSLPTASQGTLLWTRTPGARPQPRCFSTTARRSVTRTLLNPQLDEDGNEMRLEITARAAKRLAKVMEKDGNPRLALRIQVESGGCHGFQYVMSLVTLPEQLPDSSPASVVREDDSIFTYAAEVEEGDAAGETGDPLSAPKIILDTPSLELLKGSKVDFTMELIGSQFKIVDNPLATSSCGCGTSFDIKI